MSIPPELTQDDIAAVIVTPETITAKLRTRLEADGVDLDDWDFMAIVERSDWDDDTKDFSGFGRCGELWRLFSGTRSMRSNYLVLGGLFVAVVNYH